MGYNAAPAPQKSQISPADNSPLLVNTAVFAGSRVACALLFVSARITKETKKC
jgi:hypothetical protein